MSEETFEWPHRATIKEHEINTSKFSPKLPAPFNSIGGSYIGVERDINKYGENITPEQKESLLKRSIALADLLDDYAERDLPEDPEIINQQNKLAMEKEQKEKLKAALDKVKAAKEKKDWEAVKAGYAECLEIEPDNASYKEEIGKIDTLITEEKNKTATAEKNYQALIASGDAAFQNKKWADAKSAYKEAAKLFPDEKYPQDQLATVETAEKAGAGTGAPAPAKQKASRDLVAEAFDDLDIDL